MVAERFGLWTDVTWPSTVSYDEWGHDTTEDPADDPATNPAESATDAPATDPAAGSTEVTVAGVAPPNPSGAT